MSATRAHRPPMTNRGLVGYGVESHAMFYWSTDTRHQFPAASGVVPFPQRPSREVSMRTSKVIRILARAAFLGTLASGIAAAQTQTGTITGRVTDAANGQPVAAAQVSIVGTNVGTQATTEGVYTLRGVNPGSVELRVLRVGFAETKQPITVTAGQTTTANIQMRAVAATL